MESYGDGRDEGSGAFARKIEFELFVTEIMDRDPGIELVTASLWDGVSSKSPAYEADLVALYQGRPLLVQVKLNTPQTSRRVDELGRELAAAGQSYSERHLDGLEPRLVVASRESCRDRGGLRTRGRAWRYGTALT